MKLKFDFSLEAWLQNVEVEADSIEEAKSKLFDMSLQDMLEEGYVKDQAISDVDYEIEEITYTVHVTDIEYDISPEDVIEDDNVLDGMSEEEIDEKIDEVVRSLPQELTVEVTCDPEELDDKVVDAVTDETNWLVRDCFYEIVDTK